MGFTKLIRLPELLVSSYLTVSPLPVSHDGTIGGLLSVALSMGSLPPGVTRHPALWSPDFPPIQKESAAAQSTPLGEDSGFYYLVRILLLLIGSLNYEYTWLDIFRDRKLKEAAYETKYTISLSDNDSCNLDCI